MKTRFALVLMVVCAVAAVSPVLAQTAVHGVDLNAANTASLQASGKSLLFTMHDVSQSVRLSIVDLRGKSVWSRTVTPVEGLVQVAWNGTSTDGGVAARGVYVLRAVSIKPGTSEIGSALLQQQFAYTP
jgi:flagellar hook assembly protein FlgD